MAGKEVNIYQLSHEPDRTIKIGDLAERTERMLREAPPDWPEPLLSIEAQIALDLVDSGPDNGSFE